MGRFAVVLAGGFGKRLMPLTETLPKPLLPLGESTVLERVLEKLRDGGFTEAAVTTMYRAAQLESTVFSGIELTFYRESVPLGTAGGIKAAASGVDDNFAVVSGDVVFEFDLGDIYRQHCESGAVATVVCTRVAFPTEYGTVTARGGEIVAFEEKAPWACTRTDLVNTGIYIFSPEVLSYIGDGVQDIARDLIPTLLRQGKKVACIEEKGFWCDIGTPQSYYGCCFRYGKGRNVLFGDATLEKGAFAEGALLFDGVSVAAGARLRDCIVCEQAHIGEGAYVGEGCIIGAGCDIGAGAYIASGTVLRAGLNVGKEAKVMKSVFFGELRRRNIENGRISGLYGSYISGELCLRLGGALVDAGGSRVGVMHDGSPQAKLLAEFVAQGVRLYGGDSALLSDGFESLCAFAAVELRLRFTVLVKYSGGAASLCIYDGDGLVPTAAVTRQIEAWLGMPKAPQNTVGDSLVFEDEHSPRYLYAEALTKVVPSLEGARFFVGEKNGASEFLLAVAHKLGAQAEYGNGAGDRFDVSEDGYYAEVATAVGGECSFWGLVCIAGMAAKGAVALPALAPGFVVEAMRRRGHAVVFFGNGGERGAAYRCFWSYDAVALCLMAVYASVTQKKSIAELDSMTPKRVIESQLVLCDEDKKAAAMARVAAVGDSGRGGEGVVLRYGRGTVLVVPQEIGAFRLFAEAVSAEAAAEIVIDARKKLGVDK